MFKMKLLLFAILLWGTAPARNNTDQHNIDRWKAIRQDAMNVYNYQVTHNITGVSIMDDEAMTAKKARELSKGKYQECVRLLDIAIKNAINTPTAMDVASITVGSRVMAEVLAAHFRARGFKVDPIDHTYKVQVWW